MILGYYILWRLTAGIPVDLLYVILIAVSMVIIIEAIDRIGKAIKKKKVRRE